VRREAPWQILIIEDDREVAQTLEDWLHVSLGRPVHCQRVTTLAEGLAILAREHIDLVMLDLNLPDSRHLASLKAVVEQSPGVPCVVVTGLQDAGLAAMAADAGAAEFLAKTDMGQPHLIDRILFAVARHRRLVHLFAELAAVSAVLKATAYPGEPPHDPGPLSETALG
jgi:DNA-binding NtrC family response regulator